MPEEKGSTCCHDDYEPRKIRDEFDYGAEGEQVRVLVEECPVEVCRVCGEVFYGPAAGEAHHRAICKALGLLTPEEIKAIRERFGMTQEAFAKLTGIGVATLSRWERGRLIQNRALDLYLRVLSAVPEAFEILRLEEVLQAMRRGPAASAREARITPDQLLDKLLKQKRKVSYGKAYELLIGPKPKRWQSRYTRDVLYLAKRSSTRTHAGLTIRLDTLVVNQSTQEQPAEHFTAGRGYGYTLQQWRAAFGDWPLL